MPHPRPPSRQFVEFGNLKPLYYRYSLQASYDDLKNSILCHLFVPFTLSIIYISVHHLLLRHVTMLCGLLFLDFAFSCKLLAYSLLAQQVV